MDDSNIINIEADRIHQALLSLIAFFHDFCEKEGITYYALGGTSLGAYRHSGFIPWDDDVDVGLPRSDYDRLLSMEKKLPEKYEIRHYKNAEGYPYNFAKLIDNGTTLIEDDYRNYIGGLYIDIFPLDGACSNDIIEKYRQKKIFFWHSAVMSHYSTSSKIGIVKKAFKKFAEVCNPNYLHKKVDRLMRKYSWDEAEIIANYLGSWHEKEVMKKGIFGKPTLHKFEDIEIYCQEKLPDYLEHMYGDYMKLPPKEKQVFRHNFYYLDLKTPYKQYKESSLPGE